MDKENILRHTTSSKILRSKGISVTEDFSNKRQASKNINAVELRKKIVLSDVSRALIFFTVGSKTTTNKKDCKKFKNCIKAGTPGPEAI